MFMNSFSLRAVGNLATAPEIATKGDVTYTRLHLIGNDYVGKDEEGAVREAVTGVWFVAFGMLAEAIARTCRKGDQLILEARIRSDNWTDGNGAKQYDYSFVVEGFRFGAPGKTKREELDTRRVELVDGGRLAAEG
jgi:single-strand DNA-binding protein